DSLWLHCYGAPRTPHPFPTRRPSDLVPAEGVDPLELDDEVQALVHQQREGVSRIQADGADDGRNLVAEETAHPQGLPVGPLATALKADLLSGQFGQQYVIENAVLESHLLMRYFADLGQYLMRLQAIRAGLLTGEGDLLLESGHADFEELVQIAGEDQQELQALQQRVGLVQRLFQHPDIELQLG